ncbi:MAG: type II toxin-antitoxin system YafQ family toxin [Firmicutes bacterium]|nr:type II toxin-antitoxin system YafQ family toxin [Bacillota bacterium]
MKTAVYTSAFKHDYKQMSKRGKDLGKLKEVILILQAGEPIHKKYLDHPLKGSYKGYRDLHIEPDWLLIYKATQDMVFFERTGTHSDLFGE